MKKYMEIYYPEDEENAEKKAAALCIKIWSVYLTGSIFFLLMKEISFSDLCLAVCGLVMGSRYVLYKAMDREERKLLKRLEEFLGELRFQYSYSHHMEEALEECISRQKGSMFLHGRYMAQSLREEEDGEEYIKRAPNRFLALLFALCKSILDYGDREIDGESVFLSNIGIVKESVETELLKRKKTEHIFSGLLITCMIPLFFVKIIEMWAISNMEELRLYYQGSYGMLTTLLLCVIAMLCYNVVQHMQYELISVSAEKKWLLWLSRISWIDRLLSIQVNRNYKKSIQKHHNLKDCGVLENMKQFLLLQYITSLAVFMLILAGLFNYRNVSRNQIIVKADQTLGNIYQMPKEEQKEIRTLVRDVVTGKKTAEREEFVFHNRSEKLENTLYQEVQKAREQWKNWQYPWFVWLMPPVGGMLAYVLRYRVVLIKKRKINLRREEEILVFQSIILFLMHMERIRGEEILQWLEKFAFYFRNSIAQALYRLVYQDYEEAELVIEGEDYKPMLFILEGVMACDRLPVEKAFLQMRADYSYMAEKYKEGCSSYIQDKSAIGKVLSFVPLYMTVGLKLIVPFVLEGLSKLNAYAESMKQFM